jgi:hypothetical protein
MPLPITDGIILSVYSKQIIFLHAFLFVKPSIFFTGKNADRKETTNKRFINKHFLSVNQSVKYASTE